uniref:DUF753 domain-containing protein n=2 Tax=Lutzomyia longipalpis TaxID=7200 RepID=A0A1B0CBD5_LUTLO
MKKILILIFLLLFIGRNESQEAQHKCYQCKGNLKSECAFYQNENSSSIAECPEDAKEDYKYECYVSVVGGIVHRGCRSDKFCDLHTCTVSNSDLNNDRSVALMKCIQCTSMPGYGYHPKCKDKPEEILPTNCFSTEYFGYTERGCYSAVIDEFQEGIEEKIRVTKVERGCDSFKYSRCDDDEDKACIRCLEDGCNVHIHQVSLSGKIFTNALLIFLCLFLVDKSRSYKVLNLLTAIFIIALVHESNALNCIKCDSFHHESCHFMQTVGNGSVCTGRLPEGIEDRCFVYYNQVGVTIRGCLSEHPNVPRYHIKTCLKYDCNIEQTAKEYCAIQDAQHLHYPLYKSVLLRMITPYLVAIIKREAMVAPKEVALLLEQKIFQVFVVQEMNVKVAEETLAILNPCTGTLKAGTREQCYVTIESYTELIVIRGCTGDNFCDEYRSDCLICNHDGCNYHNKVSWFFEQQCLQCSSNPDQGDYDENCQKQPTIAYRQYCPVDDYYSVQDTGCYSIWMQCSKE